MKSPVEPNTRTASTSDPRLRRGAVFLGQCVRGSYCARETAGALCLALEAELDVLIFPGVGINAGRKRSRQSDTQSDRDAEFSPLPVFARRA